MMRLSIGQAEAIERPASATIDPIATIPRPSIRGGGSPPGGGGGGGGMGGLDFRRRPVTFFSLTSAARHSPYFFRSGTHAGTHDSIGQILANLVSTLVSVLLGHLGHHFSIYR